MDFYPNLPRGLTAAELRHNTDRERLNAELKQVLKEHVDIVSQPKTLTDDALKEFKLEYRPICRKTNPARANRRRKLIWQPFLWEKYMKAKLLGKP